MTRQVDPERKAVFLAALEYGVSPVARADYTAPRRAHASDAALREMTERLLALRDEATR